MLSLLSSVNGFTASPYSARGVVRSHVSMSTISDFSATKIDGTDVDLSAFKGKPTLILNVASL
jgi:hypothetical protein